MFSAPSPASGNDLWLLPQEKGRKPAEFIASPADEMQGKFALPHTKSPRLNWFDELKARVPTK